MTHELKLQQPYFDQVKSGEKNFEVRINKRGYQKGDTLLLRAWSGSYHCFIEPYEPLKKRVTYVHSGFGLQPGYVILGLVDEA